MFVAVCFLCRSDIASRQIRTPSLRCRTWSDGGSGLLAQVTIRLHHVTGTLQTKGKAVRFVPDKLSFSTAELCIRKAMAFMGRCINSGLPD